MRVPARPTEIMTGAREVTRVCSIRHMTGATMERDKTKVVEADAIERDLDDLLGDDRPTGKVVSLMPADTATALMAMQAEALGEHLRRCAD